MPPFDAFHLPRGVAATKHERRSFGELECRVPVADARLLQAATDALRDTGSSLRKRPVAGVVEAVGAAAGRLADPRDPLRRQAEDMLPRVTGYSPAMTRLILDRMTADWAPASLRRLMESELGDPTVLDGFVPAGDGRRTRALGPGLSFHVFAGNVPGVAVTSLIRSLLVKSPVLGKLASGEPVLAVQFARALTAVDAELGDAMALLYWPGGAEEPERQASRAADRVVVYGGQEAVESMVAHAGATPVVVHGPRFSVGLVGREALRGDLRDLARAIASAVVAFDQQGCVSPHAVWVERGGEADAAELARAVAAAMADLEAELPRGRVSSAEAAAIQQERGAAEMRGHAGAGVRLFASEDTSWTVVLDEDPAFRPSCLNRFLRVHPAQSLEVVVDRLAPFGERLQSVALAAVGARRVILADRLAAAGASRVTTFDRLAWPPPEWHHDGRGPLVELLRWVDLED